MYIGHNGHNDEQEYWYNNQRGDNGDDAWRDKTTRFGHHKPDVYYQIGENRHANSYPDAGQCNSERFPHPDLFDTDRRGHQRFDITFGFIDDHRVIGKNRTDKIGEHQRQKISESVDIHAAVFGYKQRIIFIRIHVAGRCGRYIWKSLKL